jgi:hypothetical protein
MAVVISGDTGITSVNGTATAPSITGADTNTGIVYGTDTLSLATGGTTAVTVDSSQNVGIGTSSPAHKLDINGNTNLVSTAYLSWDGSSSYSIQGVGGGSGYIRAITDGSEAMRIDSAGLFKMNSGYGSVATAYGCRAWVNFNGAGTIGTNQTIRASGNISSVGHSAAGRYEINFATALPDTNYAVAGAVSLTSGSYAAGDNNIITPYTLSTSSCSIAVTDATSNTNQNPIIACIQITR